MKKKMFAMLSVAVVVICVAGIAYAASVKIHLAPPPDSDEPDASGQVILTYAKGQDKTIIQVNCKGLTPEAMYVVGIDGGWQVIYFIAKKNGNGSVHTWHVGDLTSTPRVWISGTGSEGETVLVLESILTQ